MTNDEFKKTQYTFYEIVCNDEFVNGCYVGSTRDFNKRKSVHKCRSRNIESYQYPLYKWIRHFGGWDNFTMRPIEVLECGNHLEAMVRETYWITQKNAKINHAHKPMTQFELDEHVKGKGASKHYYANRERELEKYRLYYQANREEIRKRRKEKYNYVKLGLQIPDEQKTREILTEALDSGEVFGSL